MKAGNTKFLPRLEKCLKENNSGNGFVGTGLTYPDVLALEPLETITPHFPINEYPLLQKLHETLLKTPQLSEWLSNRKCKTQDEVLEYRTAVRDTLRWKN